MSKRGSAGYGFNTQNFLPQSYGGDAGRASRYGMPRSCLSL